MQLADLTCKIAPAGMPELLVDFDRAGFPLINAGGFWSLFRMQPASITMSQRFAEQSELTHHRYFREEMGRERTKLDLALRHVAQWKERLSNPGATLARIQDQIAPRDFVFAEASPPDWFAGR